MSMEEVRQIKNELMSLLIRLGLNSYNALNETDEKFSFTELFLSDNRVNCLIEYTTKNKIAISEELFKMRYTHDGSRKYDIAYLASESRYKIILGLNGKYFFNHVRNEWGRAFKELSELNKKSTQSIDRFDLSRMIYLRSDAEIILNTFPLKDRQVEKLRTLAKEIDKKIKKDMLFLTKSSEFVDIYTAFWMPESFWWEHIWGKRFLKPLFSEPRKIDRNAFKVRLTKAISETLAYGRRYLINDLPKTIRLNLYSHDEKFLRLTSYEAIDKLLRRGKVPMWADLQIVKVVGNITIIEVSYNSERFTDDERLIYDFDRPFPPFKPSSPWLPPGFQGLERSGKFLLRGFDEEKGK